LKKTLSFQPAKTTQQLTTMKKLLLFIFALYFLPTHAAKLDTVKVVDKDYLMVFFKDGIVEFVDDGGNDGHEENNFVTRYGDELDSQAAAVLENWIIKSSDDEDFGPEGVNPVNSFRKSKLNGLAQFNWNTGTDDWNYDYTLDHSIFLELPASLKEGKTYTLEINSATNTDRTSYTFTYSIFTSPTEAIHLNLVGFSTENSIKAADLYMWMGDGGARDYSSFEGNAVYIYDEVSEKSYPVGKVEFYRSKAPEAVSHLLIASDVWTADFTVFNAPGTYRIAIEGVGCSEPFEIASDIYSDPFAISSLGYFYMRLGQQNPEMAPPPRTPYYIPGVDPPGFKVIITDFSPYHPEWNNYSGDKWDQPGTFKNYIMTGSPENPNAYGGWSDAADWDRHIEHVINIYDILLPYILSNGKLNEDNLRIAESGNGIPDILDEARQEVDFWLRLRFGKGYSHGITIPGDNIMYQADNTPMAAWANAASAAMLSDAFRIAGETGLMEAYRDSAINAYNYAEALPEKQLDIHFMCGLRGRDLKMMTAASLYNVTGNTDWENIMAAESAVTGPTSDFIGQNNLNQLYANASYLTTPQTVNYPALRDNMVSAAVYQAKEREANKTLTRPSRRAADEDYAHFHTEQQVQRCILGHAVATDPADKAFLLDALILEADWSLGRNSSNLIQMTTQTTSLADKRSVTHCYSSGYDDGYPGTHPGHTPYMNLGSWGGHRVMSNPIWLAEQGYPDVSEWPRSETWYDVRYIYAHSEFTPAQTMRGKQALYSYLHALGDVSGPAVPVSGLELDDTDITLEGSEAKTLGYTVSPPDASNTFVSWESSDETIVKVDYNGIITGVSEGSATVTATTMDGGISDQVSVTVNNVAVSGVNVLPASINILIGDSETLTAEIMPANALNQNLSWESDIPGIAKVDMNGMVTGVSPGDAVITVTTEDGNFSATCDVTIEDLPDQLAIYRDNEQHYDYIWENNAVRTEIEQGAYEGLKHMQFDYAMVSWWSGMGFGYNTPIDVSRFKYLILAVDGPQAPANIYIRLDDSTSASTNAYHLPASDSYQHYKIDLEEMTAAAPIDLSILNLILVGMAGAPEASGTFFIDDIYFTASTEDVPVESVEVIPEFLTLDQSLQGRLSAHVSPSTATDKGRSWISLDPSIATVDAKGSVEGMAEGIAHIVVTTSSGTFSDTAMVTVPQILVTGIKLNRSTANLYNNKTLQLRATIEPSKASNKNVNWNSDNEEIATVSETGLVTGLTEGVTIITATSEDGGFSAEATITVLGNVGFDPHSSDKISIYPNPVSRNEPGFRISGLESGKWSVVLFDKTGRSIVEKEISTLNGEINISLEKLSPGIYIVQLKNNKNYYRKKLVFGS
jgi:endoglucanase